MDAVLLRRNYAGTSRRLFFGWLRDWDDLGTLEEPVPPSECVKQVKNSLDLVRGTRIGVAWMSDTLLTTVYDAMGLDHFCLKLYDDPQFVIHLLDHFTQAGQELAEALSDLPLAFYLFQDDLAGNQGPFVSPSWLKEHWVPRVNRILAPIRAKNIPIIFHCCGNLEKILPMAVQMEFKAIQPIQPTCNDIYHIKQQYGDVICLMGNMDINGCLAHGTVDDVVRDTQEHIHRLSANGGYVVASSHSITEAVRPENYAAMIETAHSYGRYR
jgi:uroporphyrinogen-III decarboxylase